MPLDDSAESASATAAIEQLRICDKMPAATLLKTESNASPFKIHERDIEVLAQSEGFSILRDHLADHYPSE